MGAKEVVLIPNAVEFNAPVQGPARENRLITVSRLTEKNGLLYLIKALPQILEEHPDARLEVIGYGPLQGQLQKTVEALGVAAAVEFKGHVPNERVNERLAAAAVFVRPSLEEGFGIAFVEAMAIGLPVVGTKVGGITDIVTDRVNGLLVEPLDSQSLALAINELLGNHPLAKKLGANGAKSVRERFDVGKAADAFTTVYKRISARD